MRDITLHLAHWADERGLPCDVSLDGNVAIFSPDRTLRYVVTRKTGEQDKVLVACGLNPSKADAFTNDPTVTRIIGFARRERCGLYVMLNTDAFRATEPKDLFAAAARGVDVAGEHNDNAIRFVFDLLEPGDVALAAWGVHVRRGRADRIAELASAARIPLSCLGVTKGGEPKHPLYLASGTPLQPFRGAA
jgi:hypothetical protein